ncbi:hypothetical protein PLESTF_001861700 [Pleodorina starrii]|nr:hypothetical protein PLESTF_001861700 [Pleodorina starrii]
MEAAEGAAGGTVGMGAAVGQGVRAAAWGMELAAEDVGVAARAATVAAAAVRVWTAPAPWGLLRRAGNGQRLGGNGKRRSHRTSGSPSSGLRRRIPMAYVPEWGQALPPPNDK